MTKVRHKPDKGFERGKLLVSIPELQEACSHKVGFRKETPTKKQIFIILEWLRNPHDGNQGGNNDFRAKKTMIGTTKTTRGMVVKVYNYNVYQEPENYKKSYAGNAEGNGERTAEGQCREREGDTIHNNVKNDENVNNSIYASGDDINSSYKHVGKSKDELQE